MLHIDDLARLTWLEIELTLQARRAPRHAHPLVVLEAVLKGVFEAAGLDQRLVKQLWHCPGKNVETLTWRPGTRIPLIVQLFGMEAKHTAQWLEQLHARFAPVARQNFDLVEVGPFRLVRMESSAQKQPEEAPEELYLDFLTPVPLPHRPGEPQTALDGEGFLRLCQTRLRKLFGQEGVLPEPPVLDTSLWRYWRTEHRSRSQGGNPMFLNGCIGPLGLKGPTLPAWRPWLELFERIGLGERLSFSQGRLICRKRLEEFDQTETSRVPLHLRRPYVLDADMRGVSVSLSNENLVVEGGPAQAAIPPVPLMRIASVELQGHCTLSTPLIEACVRHNIPLMLAIPGQTPVIILGQEGEARRYRRLALHHTALAKLDEAMRARLAARIVEAKLRGYAVVVRQRYQAGDHVLLANLERAMKSLAQTERLAIVRGWEGWFARQYHRWLGRHTHELADFTQRRHRGEARDPINAMLNYGYALLRHRVGVAVRLAGLDPYLGVLHEANGRHEALVSDIMEPYRPCIDRMILRLINLRRVRLEGFVEESGVLRLGAEIRKRMVESFVQLFEGEPRHGGMALEKHLRRQVCAYRKAVLEGKLAQWHPVSAFVHGEHLDEEAEEDDEGFEGQEADSA